MLAKYKKGKVDLTTFIGRNHKKSKYRRVVNSVDLDRLPLLSFFSSIVFDSFLALSGSRSYLKFGVLCWGLCFFKRLFLSSWFWSKMGVRLNVAVFRSLSLLRYFILCAPSQENSLNSCFSCICLHVAIKYNIIYFWRVHLWPVGLNEPRA